MPPAPNTISKLAKNLVFGVGNFYVYIIMAISIIDGAQRLPSFFILHSSIFNFYPGSGDRENAEGRDNVEFEVAISFALLSDRCCMINPGIPRKNAPHSTRIL